MGRKNTPNLFLYSYFIHGLLPSANNNNWVYKVHLSLPHNRSSDKETFRWSGSGYLSQISDTTFCPRK